MIRLAELSLACYVARTRGISLDGEKDDDSRVTCKDLMKSKGGGVKGVK